jgi:hypothetical protein
LILHLFDHIKNHFQVELKAHNFHFTELLRPDFKALLTMILGDALLYLQVNKLLLKDNMLPLQYLHYVIVAILRADAVKSPISTVQANIFEIRSPKASSTRFVASESSQ